MTIVGKDEAKSSVMIEPDADHVKTSICPGVSTTMYSNGGSRGFSHNFITYNEIKISIITKEIT